MIKTSWDDATVQELKIAELLFKYNLVNNTIFYFPVMPQVVNEPKGRQSLSEEQQKTIAKSFEIGGHTITHPLLTRIPIDLCVPEVVDSRKMLQEKFNQDINSFAYPRGYANPEIQLLVSSAGYTNARSTLVGYVHKSENVFFEQTTVHVGCDRKEYGGVNWLDYAKKMYDIYKTTPDGIYHLWGHGFEVNNYPNGLSMLEELFMYISEK